MKVRTLEYVVAACGEASPKRIEGLLTQCSTLPVNGVNGVIEGKAAFRYALYQAALIASTRNRYFIEYFSKLIAGREREQGIKTKMRVKMAAKMLIIAWTLWKNEDVFQGKYLLQ